MINNNQTLKVPIPDPTASCNINSDLSVTEGIEATSLNVTTNASLEGDVTMGDVNVLGLGTLQGNVSAAGPSNLGTTNLCNKDIDVQNSNITGLATPVNGMDGLNYEFVINSYMQFQQYVSTQWETSAPWPPNTLLDWTTLQDYNYGSSDPSNMIRIQGSSLYLLIPSWYQISININKAYDDYSWGGQVYLKTNYGSNGENSDLIGMANCWTSYWPGFGHASVNFNIGALIPITQQTLDSGQFYLTLGTTTAQMNITYFNYRIIRYPLD